MRTDRCKKPGWFRCASVGDVHLGNPNTPTALTIRSLHQYLHEALIKDLDMLIIEGDLFDRLLNNGDDNVYRIQAWATALMRLCAKHDTLLRIVEGTPSHDWFQSTYFVEQKVNAGIDVDLHYAKTLSIEYIERFDMHVLYVPDRCLPHTDDILVETRLQLARLNLTQVDFAIMHGAFKYQLPAVVTEPTHNEQAYLDIVKYFIFIGHVHQCSQYERILAAGSFDRHSHGDEGDKGFYDVSVREDGTHKITFVINHKAKQYVTLDCHGLDTKAVNVLVRKRLETLPKGSNLRLRCNQNDAAGGYVDVLKVEYPDYDWAPAMIETVDKKKRPSLANVLAEFDMSAFLPITPQSLLELLHPQLTRHAPDAGAIERCLKHAETILEV